ncbi:MAG: ABC transporter permease [Candidatus Aminicenantaceae bacterium]
MKIRAIASNTFKEAIRDRILYLLLFFAAVTIISSRILALLTVGDRVKIIKDVGLASLSLFGALMAIVMGTSLVHKEIDKKTIYTLLSKPIHRSQFILGKFFGLILTLFMMLLFMSLIFLALVFSYTFTIDWNLLLAIFLIFLELSLITSVAILFSCFSTPILSSIFSLSFYLIGHLSWGLETLIQKINPGPVKVLIQIIHLLLPDLENFNIKTEVVHNLPLPSHLFIFAPVYGFFFTLFCLTIASFIFRKRDFI